MLDSYSVCGSDEESVLPDIQQDAVTATGNPKKITDQTAEFFTSSRMKLDSDDEISIVIPNEIASQNKNMVKYAPP